MENHTSWNEVFTIYQEFKKEYGREPKQREKYRNLQLGRWCCTQKTFYRENKLQPERKELLQEAGFPFHNLRTAYWEDMYLLHVQFKKEYGREPMPGEKYCGTPLGKWCDNQRIYHEKGRMTVEREMLFREAGFRF